ncbi:MAG: IPExxxVDY family protein [Bacteroidetes bacterium]|nr:MAG: IPExxxVDY family protein [Bacteroidota bacterium]
MARKKLLIENDYNFFLFGISCPEKSFRLCFALNNQLKAMFAKNRDMELIEKNQTIAVRFPVFAYRDEEMFTDYRVIVNKVENKILVSEFKQADYLLMVQGGMPYSEKASILKKIKEVTFVQTAFEIDPKKIKSKENFVF